MPASACGRVVAIAPCFNEAATIGDLVGRVPRDAVDEVLVVDDGSTDGSAASASSAGATVLTTGATPRGVGAALRMGYRYALENGFDVAVVMAGNGKDRPEEIPRLLEPIADGSADFVQGSRYLKRDASFGGMPLSRRFATRVHPLMFSLVAKRWVTESTNGFRAVHRRVLADRRLDLDQPWLDAYELEPYLYLRAIALGHRTVEVPVSKVYRPANLGPHTKMRPVVDWWRIVRPMVLVGLGIRE